MNALLLSLTLVLLSLLSSTRGFLRNSRRPTSSTWQYALMLEQKQLEVVPAYDNEAKVERELNMAERLLRTLRFYRTAIPIFASYKVMEQTIRFRREMGENVTLQEEEKMYSSLHDVGSDALVKIITDLQGFYVKTGQIISTRVDIFPSQYTSKLSIMQDGLDPLPAQVIKDVVRRELLDGAELSDLFAEFDDEPLGSASIAQVHRARLLDGRVVAVKVQRPNVEAKLLGDIANLKQFAKIVADSLPIDYYKVFCELERTLKFELDFLYEAQATAKVASAVSHTPNNVWKKPAVTVPLPIPGLVCRRVMVMEYIEGVALSKLNAEMSKRGIKSGAPESLLLGKKLLTALTDAYANMIFGSGIIHGGNIFILEQGEVCLLDCGQIKVLTTPQRLGLAGLVLQVNQWEKENKKMLEQRTKVGQENEALKTELSLGLLTKRLADTVRSFGVTFKEGAGDDCAAAVAVLLFGNTETKLPGGYAGEEISPDSPIVQVTEFPQELVLLGRATVMIKGIANRLGMSWGLSDRWADVAAAALAATQPSEFLPIWSVARPTVATTIISAPDERRVAGNERIRFKDVAISALALMKLFRAWLMERISMVINKIVPLKTRQWITRKAISMLAKSAQ